MNLISISGMLTLSQLAGQNVKPRWPPMEGNFVRQFQSSLRSCTSVPVTNFYNLLYIIEIRGSSPLHDFNLQFLFGLAS